jgi:hypothetical protein
MRISAYDSREFFRQEEIESWQGSAGNVAIGAPHFCAAFKGLRNLFETLVLWQTDYPGKQMVAPNC